MDRYSLTLFELKFECKNISYYLLLNVNRIQYNKMVRLSKLVPEIKDKPFVERIEAIGWSALEERFTRGDLIQLHKIQHSHDRVTLLNGDQKLKLNSNSAGIGKILLIDS
ncbi:hypothetical protein BpHYR1_031955 [Brachionus plicatilis]|uniref:Uncharacterized protein n=1 Tax=Brachionus plicatilis TaxID=10195 RepID=A0A3M7S448_BRAPC|nr:hypothetical protein BpHYR1_031955 [Brachionus plicatilis]